MAQGWKESGSWDLSPSLLNIQGLHNLRYISLTSWEDTPNWMVEDSGSITQKTTRKIFKDSNLTCQWDKLIWTSFIPHVKTLMLWKVLYHKLSIDKDIQIRCLSLCSMCSLCRKQEESFFHLFFYCSVTSQIWNYTKQVFPEFSPLSINDIIDFLMLAGSLLVNLVRLATITYSIWMIWRMSNHARFQKNISICSAIHTIKGFIRMTSNASRKHMRNDIVNFSCLNFFYITMRCQKETSPIHIIWKFSHVN